MPKETFFNLPDDKKDRILEAAKKEFTHNVLLKSRVSNIIKDADIPRGSFYQYFEDLDDLYFYVLDLTFDEMYSTGKMVSQQTSNLYEFIVKSFEYDYDTYHLDQRKQFMMNAFRSISENTIYSEQLKERNEKYILDILDKMDLSNIKFKTKKERIKLYHFLQNAKREVIHRSMFEKVSKEQAVVELKWYLDIIWNGLLED